MPSLDGSSAFRAAEHIHARGSEGPASMTAQAAEANRHVDVMWFTDHDWREAGIGAPRVVHFNSLTDELLPPNPAWTWQRQAAGVLAEGRGGIETDDVSPADPDPGGALWARAVGQGQDPASLAWFRVDDALRNSSRTPAYGQSWQLEVLLRQASPDAWGFVRVGLSYHPATGRRPPAYYFVEYRFGPFRGPAYSVEELAVTDLGSDGGGEAGVPAPREGETALLGVVWVPQEPGAYQTARLDFTTDLEQLFPGMIARDNSIRALWLGATSRAGAPADVCFDYLRMDRVHGQEQLEDRRTITAELAERYPRLRMYDGTEVSYGGGHRHWLGGDVELPTYDGTQEAKGAAPSPTESVRLINAGGGLAIANHPFGTSGRRLTDDRATVLAQRYVADLVATEADGGLAGIEIFYRDRAGASLEHHWLLYRMAVRQGLVLTASGVSDNHWGRVGSWTEEKNHFVTGLLAEDLTEAALLDAQRRGRAFSSEIGSFEGQLDLALDEDVMGQIAVRPQRVSRRLRIQATALPRRSTVEVWAVPVDQGGTDSEPGGVVARVPSTAFTGASATATVEVDTTADTAFAVMVVNRKGVRIAGSNPVWHLRSEPSWTVPDDRRAG